MTNFVLLLVSGNKLSGEIPNTLGECVSLRLIYLDDNSFEGNIPQSLKSLRGLEELDLSNNKLSGQVPIFFGKLPFLNNLNLSFNDFQGKLPEEGVFRNTTALSIIGNNKLCGGIPKLRLPKCANSRPPHIPKHNNRRKYLILLKVLTLVVVIIVIIMCLLISFYVVKHRRARKNDSSSSSSSVDKYFHLRLSYSQLLKATDGFSPERLISVGSYGSVFKGLIRIDGDENERVVAVKVLKLQQDGASKSFIVECNSLRNIRHQNLIKILIVCSSIDYRGNSFKALVFEFMANGSLEDWIHQVETNDEQNNNGSIRSNLNLLQRLNVAIDVASALDYLHHQSETQIVHRDLKLSNILLDEDMNAHVGDFGLAKFLTAIVSTSSTQDQTSSSAKIKGSIGYVAPEYGMGSEASIQGDVYSFGIVLLEMFIGKRPTDDMFNEGLSLHNFSKMALSHKGKRGIMEIVDQRLLIHLNHHPDQSNSNNSNGETLRAASEMPNESKVKECLNSLLKIGVACSVESPRERMSITSVVMELCAIREALLRGTQ